MRRDEVLYKLIRSLIKKYEANRHKPDWRTHKIPELLEMRVQECFEFNEAIEDKDWDNAYDEAADKALFDAFIIDKLESES